MQCFSIILYHIKWLPLPLALWCTGLVQGQNLLRNPSFEGYTECPSGLGNFQDGVLFWNTPSLGSSDYFHDCSQTMAIPKNYNGFQEAFHGKAYAGLYLYAPRDYREYLTGALVSPLEKDKMYRVSLYLSLAERSDHAIKDLAVYFSGERLSIATTKVLGKSVLSKSVKPLGQVVEVNGSGFLKDAKAWQRLSVDFKASGGEGFMTVGNFKDNKRTRTLTLGKTTIKGAYYYIDSIAVVSLSPMDSKGISAVAGNSKEEGFQLNQEAVLMGLEFDFDAILLSKEAKRHLKELAEFLKSNPKTRLHLIGHTDNVGPRRYNRKLSERRAQQVAGYLQALGIEGNRTTWRAWEASVLWYQI